MNLLDTNTDILAVILALLKEDEAVQAVLAYLGNDCERPSIRVRKDGKLDSQ